MGGRVTISYPYAPGACTPALFGPRNWYKFCNIWIQKLQHWDHFWSKVNSHVWANSCKTYSKKFLFHYTGCLNKTRLDFCFNDFVYWMEFSMTLNQYLEQNWDDMFRDNFLKTNTKSNFIDFGNQMLEIYIFAFRYLT